MAEIVAGAFMTVLFEKLASVDLINLALSEGINSQLNKWKKNLTMIQAVLADAAQQQITQKQVELWVNELRDLAYDIDDVLDDMATEVVQRKLNQVSHGSPDTSKVLKIVPTCCTNFNSRKIRYGRKMITKLDEINIKLQNLVERRDNLGLRVIVNVEKSVRNSRQEQTSLLDDKFRIVGRSVDTEKLLEKLFAEEPSNQSVGVLSIVGLGGVGKTTLAKGLYNNKEVKDGFDLLAWVCVYKEFDVREISEAIYQVVSEDSEKFATLDRLHKALKDKLSNKKFLLVLDDVWDEDFKKWEVLRSPLLAGAHGSKIVVTTRHHKVASMMHSYETYDLDVLSYEKSLCLFAQSALDEQNFDNHPKLKFYAEGIVKKCGGLPLALKTLGMALRTKTDDDEWEEMLNSEIWELTDEKDILPALRLSYYDLPPHLKHLFAYCSLFPKDSVFDKNELVLLWVAEGFIYQSNSSKSKESLGQQYFEDLMSRSFFQSLTSDKPLCMHGSVDGYYSNLASLFEPSTNEKPLYIMHDLINDLAKSVAGDFFIRLDDKMDIHDRNGALVRFRHFTFTGQEYGVCRKFMKLQKSTCLRTFMERSIWKISSPYLSLSSIVLQELLPFLRFVRVLSLNNCLLIKEVPRSIGDLKHLRYLNLSKTAIERIPTEVSNLCNLQSLLVHGCFELSGLPESFVKLIHLRHLGISDTPKLNKMPLGISRLTSLQTLSKVIIEGAVGFKLSDLKGMSNLRGRLSIKGLDKVIDPIHAKDANMKQKKDLHDLEMNWASIFDDNGMSQGRIFSDSFNERTDYEVLQGLRPYNKLRNLEIMFYGGKKFPSWVGDPSFDLLTKLTLRGCGSCQHLPTLGHLRSLQILYVEGMNEIKTLDSNFFSPNDSFRHVAFPSLEVLKFRNMQGWERWLTCVDRNINETGESFPLLREISIEHCPKLAEVSVYSIPSLQVLHIEGCSEVVLRSLVSVSSSIHILTLRDIKGLTHLPEEVLKHLGKAEFLDLTFCDDLRYLWKSESDEACRYLSSLKTLQVFCDHQLVSLGEEEFNLWVCMESIREVNFGNCKNLESYSCPSTVERLFIHYCPSITSVTFSTALETPSSLKILHIVNCDNLRFFGEGCFVHLIDLSISHCDSIETIERSFGVVPMLHLKSLDINNCKNLKSFPHEHLQNLASLKDLQIYNCPSLNYSFAAGLSPPNLSSLLIGCLNNPISDWGLQHLPTSLDSLYLFGQHSGVKSFDFLFPQSLTLLKISNFTHLESLTDVLQNLTCLKKLSVVSCPMLGDLPKTTSSLSVSVKS